MFTLYFQQMLILIVFILLTGCGPSQNLAPPPWKEIAGRDRAVLEPIYRARIPLTWRRLDPDPQEALEDTTKAICHFVIAEGNEHIEITVHNFPTETIQQRIPTGAQVARWQRQLPQRSSLTERVRSVSHGGFVGLYFEAEGLMAWSLQLGSQQYHSLTPNPDTPRHRQMRADYTIKAIGPPEFITRQREAIEAFARSFELIEEIPLT